MIRKNNEHREFFDRENRIGRQQLQSEYKVKRILQRMHPNARQTDLFNSAAKVAASARQAAAFEQSDACVDLPVRPLVRYYAVLGWMKTLLYLHDLSFPASMSVLQHGISVRRSKRQPYRWPLETVYVHKDGILQCFFALSRARDNERSEFPQKLVVGDLLGAMPPLACDVAIAHQQFQHVYPLREEVGADSTSEYVSRSIAANAGMTVEEWKRAYLKAGRMTVDADGFLHGSMDGEIVRDTVVSPSEPPGLLMLPIPSKGHPWVITHGENRYLLDSPCFPQWLNHFVILYSLSALCRYNPMEWSDILTWNNEGDAYLVRAYLEHYTLQDIISLLFAASGFSTVE
jgi:hypothetical protein